MAGSKLSDSRVQQIFAVLLISALAGAHCDVSLINFSSSFFVVYDVTSTIMVSPFPPNTGPVAIPVHAPPAGIVAAPETFFFFQYTSPPNASMNITGVKEMFLTAFVYDNATITLNDGNATLGTVGFTINYLT